MKTEEKDTPRMRVDKWLWVARFFKTRSLAAQAVDGGKVRLAGERIKPAKELRVGDLLTVQTADVLWSIEVRGLMQQRRSASEAQTLYAESEESRERRLAQAAQRRLSPEPVQGERPTKRDRRMIRRFTQD